MRTIFNINLFGIDIGFNFRIQRKDFAYAIGTYSMCSDGKHVVYLDYDNFREEWLFDEMKHLIKEHKLSDIYIFSSSETKKGRSFHCICFDKFKAREYNDLVMGTNADVLFRNNSFFDLQNARVLRFSAKTNSQINRPKLYKVIRSKYSIRPKSLSHILFYERMFGIEIKNKELNDGKNDIGIIKYATIKKD